MRYLHRMEQIEEDFRLAGFPFCRVLSVDCSFATHKRKRLIVHICRILNRNIAASSGIASSVQGIATRGIGSCTVIPSGAIASWTSLVATAYAKLMRLGAAESV